MFTGIVTELGTVVSSEPSAAGRRIRVSAPVSAEGLVIGDSISVNGVCLTAVEVSAGGFAVDVVAESLARSNLGALAAGSRVDLERPMAADGRFDGHIVQGHVDGTGSVISIEPEGDARRVRVSLPTPLARFVVEKGSITVDGVSLTVTAVSGVAAETHWFEIVLIPHTLEVTVLGRRSPGDEVNLEIDVIAKYLERLMEART